MTSEEKLQVDVIDELRSELPARASKIYVRARDGTVTLAAQVQSRADKRRIDEAVGRVMGIRAVDLQISVKRCAEPAAPASD